MFFIDYFSNSQTWDCKGYLVYRILKVVPKNDIISNVIS